MSDRAFFWLNCNCMDDPRFETSGWRAMMMHIHALGKSHRTPGRITRTEVHALGSEHPDVLASILVAVGLWVRAADFDGWLIPDWRSHCRYAEGDLEDGE